MSAQHIEEGRHAFAAYEVGGCVAARTCDHPKDSEAYNDWWKGFQAERHDYEKALGRDDRDSNES